MFQGLKKRIKNRKGFTLVELIVVIAIIGILAAIAVPRLGGFGDSARIQAATAEHKIIVSAIVMWQSEKGFDKIPTEKELDSYIDKGWENGLSGDHEIKNGVLVTTLPGDNAPLEYDIVSDDETEEE